MTIPGETQSDPKAELTFSEAIRQQQIDVGDEPIEPKHEAQEAPGSLSRESAGD